MQEGNTSTMKVSKIPAALVALLLATFGVMTTISLAQADGSPLTDAICVPADAYTQTIEHAAVTSTVHHDAVYTTVHHDAVLSDPARYVWNGVDTPVWPSDQWQKTGTKYDGSAVNAIIQVDNPGNGNADYVYWEQHVVTAAYDEQVLVTAAYDETVIVTAAYTETIQHDAVVCPEPIPAPAPEKKVFVCKYVGTPGVDERLQTGDNPISVSVNAIEHNQWDGIVPGWFSDAQDRSYVLSYDIGQVEPDVSACPTPEAPVTPIPEAAVTPTVTPAVTPTSPATKSEVLAAEPNVTPTPTGQVAAVPAGAVSAGDGSTAALASTGANPLPWSLAALLLIASGSLLLPKVRRVVFRH